MRRKKSEFLSTSHESKSDKSNLVYVQYPLMRLTWLPWWHTQIRGAKQKMEMFSTSPNSHKWNEFSLNCSGTNTKRNWGWVVVVAFRNYCIWYAMNGVVIFISILVSLNQLIRLRTGITITPCSTLHTIVSLMRFVVKHLFLLFTFSCLINFIFYHYM